MINNDHHLIKQKCDELLKIARRYELKWKYLGSDLDEALLNSMEYYFQRPTSVNRPEGVFRICLRREQAKRLKFSDVEGNRGDRSAPTDGSDWRECVFEAIHRLPDRRLARIVELKYYGENGKPWTLAEIGKCFEISDERVRQLLKAAYSQLATFVRSRSNHNKD